jgi:hypothetical protein
MNAASRDTAGPTKPSRDGTALGTAPSRDAGTPTGRHASHTGTEAGTSLRYDPARLRRDAKNSRRRALLGTRDASCPAVNFTRELHTTQTRESPAHLHEQDPNPTAVAVNFTDGPGQKGNPK